MNVLYVALSLIVFVIFVYYVFDIRKKEGMTPLIANIWTLLMKLFAGAMLFYYAYMVVVVESPSRLDTISLLIAALGTSLVAAAKVTLGKYHTWAGYHKKETKIVSHGIYSRIRHPLYTGAILYEIAVLMYLAPRISEGETWFVALIAGVFTYMICFNIYLASLESREMKRKFGEEFDQYKARVRAFIPVRKSMI